MAAETHIWNGEAEDNDFDVAGNWDSNDTPVSTDTVIFPALAAASTNSIEGDDYSDILLAAWQSEPKCAIAFGERDTYAEFDSDSFIWGGTGYGFIDIENCASIQILNGTAAAAGYSFGLNLKGAGNTLTLIDPSKGKAVGLAALEDETFVSATIQITSGTVTMGDGITMTTLYVDGGTIENSSAATTLHMTGGTLRQAAGALATVNLKGGRLYLNVPAANMPTTINLYPGAILDMSEDGVAKTIGTLNYYGGSVYDPGNILTITTLGKNKGGTLSVA